MTTELSIHNLKHRMENLSQWAMYKDGIGKLHIESFIKELSEIEDNATDELAALRAQLAEARELISEAKIEIGFTLHGNTQPSISTYDKLTAYLQKVKSA